MEKKLLEKTMIKNLIITFLAYFVIISCSGYRNKEIPCEFYDIHFVEKFTDLPYFDYNNLFESRKNSFIGIIQHSGYYYGECKFIYSWHNSDHYFLKNDLEILFTRERLDDGFNMKPEHTIIGVKKINKNFMAFFISWQNNSKFNKEKNEEIYEWMISNETDSLFTNLDFSLIMKLFPDFKGHYKKIIEDSIYVNYDYPTYSYEFFDNIRFRNYQLGFKWYRRNLR